MRSTKDCCCAINRVYKMVNIVKHFKLPLHVHVSVTMNLLRYCISNCPIFKIVCVSLGVIELHLPYSTSAGGLVSQASDIVLLEFSVKEFYENFC